MAIDNLNGPLSLSKGKIQNSTLIAVVCLLLLSSCSLQKRLYNKGFYASKTHSPKKELRKQSNDTLLTHLASAKSIEMKETPAPLSIEASAKKGMITYIAPTIIDTTSRCDTLILKNGTVILTKISEVYPDRITYRFCNAPDELLRTINKTDLKRIIYVNGSKESVASSNCDNITLKNGTVILAKIISIYTGKIKYRPCPDNGGTINTINKDDVAQVVYTDETIKLLRNSGSELYMPLQIGSFETKNLIEPKTNGFAIASLVLSIINIPMFLVFLLGVGLSTISSVSYFSFLTPVGYFLASIPILLALLAIAFSIIALIQIHKSKEFQHGIGMAIVGLVLSAILLTLFIAVLAAI